MKQKYRTHIGVGCHTGLTQYWVQYGGLIIINTKLLQLASRPMKPTSSTGTVALHSTDCIHFLIICCISLMDGILKRSFSNLVPRGTNKTEAYYSRRRPRHQGSRPRQWKLRLEAASRVDARQCLEAPHHWSEYDTILYDTVYLTCCKKPTDSQLSLTMHTEWTKHVKEIKLKLMSVINPVQSHNDAHLHEQCSVT